MKYSPTVGVKYGYKTFVVCSFMGNGGCGLRGFTEVTMDSNIAKFSPRETGLTISFCLSLR